MNMFEGKYHVALFTKRHVRKMNVSITWGALNRSQRFQFDVAIPDLTAMVL